MNIPTKMVLPLLFIFVVIFLDLALVVGFSFYRPALGPTDAVIVLGAKVGTPALKNRTLQGLRAFHRSGAGILVLSGGRGPNETTSEAAAMAEVVKQVSSPGITPSLVLEDSSTDTYQNIRNSKALVPDAKNVVIITDTFHLARSVLVARRAGFDKVYWDAPSPTYYSFPVIILAYLREAAGLIGYLPKFIFG